ncbi:MAG: TIGR03915 family putative DNA repair protein [Maribacter sp.]
MDDTKVFIYDGSFNGFLTAVFVGFEENIEILEFQKITSTQKGLFSDAQNINTQISKAKRVWDSIEKKSATAIKNIYFSFLSETDGIEDLLFTYIKYIMGSLKPKGFEAMEAIRAKLNLLCGRVEREKQRIERLVEFKSTGDNVYMAEIKSNYDVLPLISRYFRYHYPKQQWIIFDNKRNYGVYYNLVSVEIITSEAKTLYLNSNYKNNNQIQNNYRYAV